MRKLASIRKIAELNPIEGADVIEVATIDGWKVVVKKGDFSVGELAVYCEIDSWIPTNLAPFLSKGQEPREYGNVKGERLKTIKLRGAVSQGLILPLSVIPNYFESGGRHYINIPNNKTSGSNYDSLQNNKSENGQDICG